MTVVYALRKLCIGKKPSAAIAKRTRNSFYLRQSCTIINPNP